MEEKYMELYTKLSRLQWLLQRRHSQSHHHHGPTADPTRGQGRVLALLKMQPEIPTKDLSYLLGIRQQSLNELLNKLEKGGYVTREPSQEDRRVMVVKLTEKGREEEQPRADLSGAFDSLTEEEQAVFSALLDRVTTALEAQLTDEDRKEIERWMGAARDRIGDDQFDRLISMWRSHPRRGDPRFRGEWWNDERSAPGHGYHGYGRDGHGVPEMDRFDSQYDGPMPDGHGPHSYSRNPADWPSPPPQPPVPPKAPHDPEDEE